MAVGPFLEPVGNLLLAEQLTILRLGSRAAQHPASRHSDEIKMGSAEFK